MRQNAGFKPAAGIVAVDDDVDGRCVRCPLRGKMKENNQIIKWSIPKKTNGKATTLGVVARAQALVVVAEATAEGAECA